MLDDYSTRIITARKSIINILENRYDKLGLTYAKLSFQFSSKLVNKQYLMANSVQFSSKIASKLILKKAI